MGVMNNGRPVVDLDDWMRNVEKRLMREERRPSFRSAADLVGPGIGPYARQVTDWDFDGPLVNGWYYADEFESVNSPDDTLAWMGYMEASPFGEGMQQVWQYKNGDIPPVSYIRTFTTVDDGTRDFTTWVQTDSGSGGTATPVGPAGGDLTGNYPDPQIADDVVAYTWVQGTASSSWSITHPLRFNPNIAVIDSSGRQVEGDVDYVDSTHIVLTFSGAFAGTAYLS